MSTTPMTTARRSPISGTTQDLINLELQHPHLKAKNSYHVTMTKQLETFRLMSTNLRAAQHFYDTGQYHMCRWRCNEIVGTVGSGAIRAWAYMLLAGPEVTPIVEHRAYFAGKAVKCWQSVIERNGVSRLPVEQARKEQVVAKRLLEEAELDKGSGDFEAETSEEVGKYHPSRFAVERSFG